MAEVKKVIKKIYSFDFSKCEVLDGNEFIITEYGNEFVNTFVKRDLDNGVIVTPAGYSKGFIYKATNNGEIYNNPEWFPEVVEFSLNLYGLKKGAFYRVNVVARNSRKFNTVVDISDNRTLYLSNNAQEILLKEDLSNSLTNKDCVCFFRANSVEENLYFKVGKIFINDIIIEEVELLKDEEEVTERDADFEFDSGKSSIVAYGVFSNQSDDHGKYSEFSKVTGKGINLYFDKTTQEYILERDNYEDTIGAPFTNANFVVDFCFTKAPYASYQITEVSYDMSPNTLKQGYIRFKVLDEGKPCKYSRINGRLSFIVRKII